MLMSVSASTLLSTWVYSRIKIGPKSNKKVIKKDIQCLNDFLIDFVGHFGSILVPILGPWGH